MSFASFYGDGFAGNNKTTKWDEQNKCQNIGRHLALDLATCGMRQVQMW